MECGQSETKVSVLDAMHYIASSWERVLQGREFKALQLPVTFKHYVNTHDVNVCDTAPPNEVEEETAPNGNTLNKKDDGTRANVHMPRYVEVLKRFDSIWQFVCAHRAWWHSDLLPDVADFERRLVLQDRHCVQ